jgi:hypothetical protein
LLQGQKAIDIIAVEPKNQCTWLIEVKDYRANRRLKPSDLINEVVQKVVSYQNLVVSLNVVLLM